MVRRLVPLVVEAVAVHEHVGDIGQGLFDAGRHEGEHDARDESQRDIACAPPPILPGPSHAPKMPCTSASCKAGEPIFIRPLPPAPGVKRPRCEHR